MSPVCFVKHLPGMLRCSAPRARKGYPQSSALRCAPFVQTKELSTLAALRCKPWEIPLPLHLLPPQAWAWAKALLCEQQQQNHSNPKGQNQMTIYSPEDNKLRLYASSRFDTAIVSHPMFRCI
jgi:hypothetical protein